MARSSPPPPRDSMRGSWLSRLDQSGFPLLISRLVLGVAFIVMGWNKASHPVPFLKQIHIYNMIPDQYYFFLNSMAAVLPWVEIVCGVLLVLGIGVRGASLLLLVMLGVFTTAIFLRAMDIYHAGNLAFCAIKFDCGCGSGEQYICHKIPENLGLMLACLIALVSRAERFCIWRNLLPAGKSPWRIEGY